jgi:hypothetical protein
VNFFRTDYNVNKIHATEPNNMIVDEKIENNIRGSKKLLEF